MAREFSDKAVVAKCNVDDSLRWLFNTVSNIPTILFSKGKIADKQIGAVPKNVLADKLKSLLKGLPCSKPSRKMTVCVFAASSSRIENKYAEVASELGCLRDQELMLYSAEMSTDGVIADAILSEEG